MTRCQPPGPQPPLDNTLSLIPPFRYERHVSFESHHSLDAEQDPSTLSETAGGFEPPRLFSRYRWKGPPSAPPKCQPLRLRRAGKFEHAGDADGGNRQGR